MYVSDLTRVDIPYPPMLYEALGYDLSGWDVAFIWFRGQFLWSDMTETGFGYALGWTRFATHRAVEVGLRGCRFGSDTEAARDFLLARVAEKDFHIGAMENIDAVFKGGRVGADRASIEAEAVRALATGQPEEPKDRDRGVADMTRWLDGLR